MFHFLTTLKEAVKRFAHNTVLKAPAYLSMYAIRLSEENIGCSYEQF